MRLASALFAVVLLTPSGLLATQDDNDGPKIPPAPVPQLRTTGRCVQDFAPPGWTIIDQKTGDLNADGRPDLAFILQGTNKALRLPNSISPDSPLDSNPYVLAVAFGNADGSYTLAMQNSTLIPRWTESTLFEYSQTVKVKQGALVVWLYGFRSGGNTYQTFVFRYQHGRFELIGHEREELNRATQGDVTYNLNYSTGQEIITESGQRSGDSVRHKRLPAKPLMSIEQVGSADDFYHFME